VRTLGEIVLLGREALTLWRQYFLQLAAWYCLGFGLHHLGQQASAQLGRSSQLLATLVFVVGVLGWLAGLIMMIHALKPGLQAPQRLAERSSAAPIPVPETVFRAERAMDVLTSTVGPFLAVYAVWGFVEDQISALFYVNLSQLSFDVDYWSISFAPERTPFYAALAAAAWLIGKIIKVLADRIRVAGSGRLALGILEVLADGTFVFAVFMTLATWLDRLQQWWEGRVIAVRLAGSWRWFLDRLPDLRLWSDLTLPEALRDGLDWCWQVLLPGAADRLLLPLMWLALTATVFGWREFRGRDAVAGTRLHPAAERASRYAPSTARSGPVAVLLVLATDDLRTKYIPVITALRVLWRAGPWFVGGYLVVSTLLWSAEIWFGELLTIVVGPPAMVETMMILDPVLELLTGLIFTTASVALYAAAFDRGMAAITGLGRRTAPASAATDVSAPPAAGSPPSTTA
jgi:hypothetical protein